MKTNLFDNFLERKWAKDHGVNYVNVPIMIQFYSESNMASMREVYENMLLLPKPILVYCTRGSDRTGIAVAIYRILANNWTYNDAVKEMDSLGFNDLFYFWKMFLRDIYINRDKINTNRRILWTQQPSQ